MQFNRRRFLCASVGSGLSAAAFGGSLFSIHPHTTWVTQTGHALGTEVTITAAHSTASAAAQAIAAAFEELELVESVLSIYRPHSQVSQLNRHGYVANVHPHLRTVLEVARDISRQSSGAFDVTIQPVWEQYQAAKQRGDLPTAADLRRALELVDWRQVSVGKSDIMLAQHGSKITLNGIAQGFAADRVTSILQQHGVKHALVNTGEYGSLGEASRGDHWTLGIQHPRQPEAYAAVVKLDGRALSTSGDYATRFTEDYQHHHLLNPQNGASPTELSSVTVVAPTAMIADALSTAVFVMGKERGLELIANTDQTDALLIDRAGQMFHSPNFPLATEETLS